MPSISVPPSFFVSERNSVYADWRSAFWRELISNSLDAGASRIRVRTAFRDGKLSVDVIDNGHGMTREVVEQVYMRLGASTKDGSGGIGGFGRARILTCFSQDSYSIRSSDFLVTGQGASYDIHPAAGPVRGCAVTVQMPQREARYLYASLQDVLRQSSLRAAVEIKLDMEAPEDVYLSPIDLRSFQQPDEAGWMRFKGWGRLGRHVETLADDSGPWADLHLNEGDRAISGRAIIRVNGMAMYEDHIGAPSQLTVNLIPGRAREVLTASRDAVRPPFRDVLQSLYDRIMSERLTGFKARPREPVTELLTSEKTRFRKGLPLPVKESAEIPIASVQASLRADLPVRDRARPEAGSPADLEPDAHAAPDRRINPHGLLYPVALHACDPRPEQRASIARYAPRSWVLPGNEGRNAELLLAAWTGACRHALGVLAVQHRAIIDPVDFRWITGFVFDRDMQACHMQINDIPHGLLLNPLDSQGRAQFRLSDPESIRQIVSLAIHEVTHVASRRHDEIFAAIMTDLVGSIRDRDIEQSIRAEIDEMRAFQAARQEFYLLQESRARQALEDEAGDRQPVDEVATLQP